MQDNNMLYTNIFDVNHPWLWRRDQVAHRW
jgi:hypothetical protein